jgi:drug/metabolite transporter (DMT)-like permease
LHVFLIGFFGITINIIFFFQGLLQAPSINAALIGSSAPIFIILYSLAFLKKEKPKSKLVTGAFIGLLGVLLILITPLFKHGNIGATGNLFYLISMLGGIISILLMRRVMKRNNPISITFWAFTLGSLGFIPFFIQEIYQYGFLTNINPQGLIGLTFGIFFSSLAAYFLQTWALKFLSAADVSVFTYIDPVVTLLIAAPLLGEFPDGVFVAGSVFVLLGIFMAEGRFHWHPFHLFLKK